MERSAAMSFVEAVRYLVKLGADMYTDAWVVWEEDGLPTIRYMRDGRVSHSNTGPSSPPGKASVLGTGQDGDKNITGLICSEKKTNRKQLTDDNKHPVVRSQVDECGGLLARDSKSVRSDYRDSCSQTSDLDEVLQVMIETTTNLPPEVVSSYMNAMQLASMTAPMGDQLGRHFWLHSTKLCTMTNSETQTEQASATASHIQPMHSLPLCGDANPATGASLPELVTDCEQSTKRPATWLNEDTWKEEVKQPRTSGDHFQESKSTPSFMNQYENRYGLCRDRQRDNDDEAFPKRKRYDIQSESEHYRTNDIQRESEHYRATRGVKRDCEVIDNAVRSPGGSDVRSGDRKETPLAGSDERGWGHRSKGSLDSGVLSWLSKHDHDSHPATQSRASRSESEDTGAEGTSSPYLVYPRTALENIANHTRDTPHYLSLPGNLTDGASLSTDGKPIDVINRNNLTDYGKRTSGLSESTRTPRVRYADTGYLRGLFDRRKNNGIKMTTKLQTLFPCLPLPIRRSPAAPCPVTFHVMSKVAQRKRDEVVETNLNLPIHQVLQFLKPLIHPRSGGKSAKLIALCRIRGVHYRIEGSTEVGRIAANYGSAEPFRITVVLHDVPRNKVYVDNWRFR